MGLLNLISQVKYLSMKNTVLNFKITVFFGKGKVLLLAMVYRMIKGVAGSDQTSCCNSIPPKDFVEKLRF